MDFFPLTAPLCAGVGLARIILAGWASTVGKDLKSTSREFTFSVKAIVFIYHNATIGKFTIIFITLFLCMKNEDPEQN